jgi:hypothetical protein
MHGFPGKGRTPERIHLPAFRLVISLTVRIAGLESLNRCAREYWFPVSHSARTGMTTGELRRPDKLIIECALPPPTKYGCSLSSL